MNKALCILNTKNKVRDITVHTNNIQYATLKQTSTNACKIKVLESRELQKSLTEGADIKFRVFWDIVPCSHVEVDRRFRGPYYLHHQGDE
jgi:hypothetical protein